MTRDKRAISLGVSTLIVVAIILIAGFGLFLSLTSNTTSSTTITLNPISLLTTTAHRSTNSTNFTTTQSSCTVPASGSGNITIIETAGQLPCGCVLVDSNSNGSLYVSTNSKVGNYVCITGSLNNSATVYLSVANSTGSIVFSPPACIAGGFVGGPTGDTCTAYWDTSQPSPQGNPIEPGVYRVMASNSQGSPVVLEANFTLS